jgi:hypothetical protein
MDAVSNRAGLAVVGIELSHHGLSIVNESLLVDAVHRSAVAHIGR